MRKILFITNRNILTTSGELRLIKNRAEELYKSYDIATDFIAFQKPDRIKSENKEEINAGGIIEAYPFSILSPFKTLGNYKKIKKEVVGKISSNKYQMVVISDFLLMGLAQSIKKAIDIPLVFDVHGAAEDIIEIGRRGSFMKMLFTRVVYSIMRNRYKKFSRYADGFFVVSDSLKDYIKNNYRINNNAQFYKIPCATSVGCHTTNEYTVSRKQYRDKYGIKDNEIVFIYSGGVSSWQCIEETIETYKNLSKLLSQPTRLLVFSHSKDAVKDIVGDNSSVIIDSYRPDELVKALCAGDYAFLLRKDCVTNNVAFPNKFLEYVQSGMRIITTPYVHEIAAQTVKNNLGIIYHMDGNIANIISFIESNGIGNSYNADKIEYVLNSYSFKTTLKSFVELFSK